jgi:hypothetical protein
MRPRIKGGVQDHCPLKKSMEERKCRRLSHSAQQPAVAATLQP